MATDIDTWAIKEQIVAILKTNATLYDATGASGKVRKILAGSPDMNDIANEAITPIIYVTNDDMIDLIHYNGTLTSNAPKMAQHILGFRILLLASGKNGPKTEEICDDFVKLILETIEADHDLTGATSSVVDSCVPVEHLIMNRNLTGSEKQGRIIKLRCRVHSS